MHRLRHEFIVRLYSTFQDQSSLCMAVGGGGGGGGGDPLLTPCLNLDFVMELAENGDLLGYIKRVSSIRNGSSLSNGCPSLPTTFATTIFVHTHTHTHTQTHTTTTTTTTTTARMTRLS